MCAEIGMEFLYGRAGFLTRCVCRRDDIGTDPFISLPVTFSVYDAVLYQRAVHQAGFHLFGIDIEAPYNNYVFLSAADI